MIKPSRRKAIEGAPEKSLRKQIRSTEKRINALENSLRGLETGRKRSSAEKTELRLDLSYEELGLLAETLDSRTAENAEKKNKRKEDMEHAITVGRLEGKIAGQEAARYSGVQEAMMPGHMVNRSDSRYRHMKIETGKGIIPLGGVTENQLGD